MKRILRWIEATPADEVGEFFAMVALYGIALVLLALYFVVPHG